MTWNGLSTSARSRSTVHHSDRGQPVPVDPLYDRLAEAGIERSVGSRGNSYDNALAESTSGLYRTELIRRRGTRRGVDNVE